MIYARIIIPTTRKNKTRSTLWVLCQARPHPDIASIAGGLDWRNTGGLFDKSYNFPRIYNATLLREGWTPETAEDNRRDYAGFTEDRTENPGALIVRGRSLGELSATIDRTHSAAIVRYQVRGFAHPTKGEYEYLSNTLTPLLIDAVDSRRYELFVEAVQGVEKSMRDSLRRIRVDVDVLENHMRQAIETLNRSVLCHDFTAE